MVHGIEESLLSVTIDGARQNKSAFHHTGNVLIDPTLLKSVDVSSGLAPADAGPGALAGVIAYETKDAADFLRPGDTFGGRSTLGYSGIGNTFRRGLTLFGAQGGLEYLLNGTRVSGDDYEDGSGAVVRGTQADLTALLGKLAYTSKSGHRFEFSADHVEDSGKRAMQRGPGGLYYGRPDFAGVVGRPSVFREAIAERKSYTFTYTDESPGGAWAPTVQLSHNEQYVEAGAAIGTNTSLSGTVSNDFLIGNGVMTGGIDFFHDTAEGHGPLTEGTAEETLDNIGVFAQMRQDLNSRVSLSYGARVDFQQLELADGQNHDDHGLSVNAAADIVLTPDLTLNFGAASSWGGYELSEASLINLGGVWAYGAPEPSRANNARVGLRWARGGWTASGALFYTEIKDVNEVLTASRATSDLTSRGVDASVGHVGERGYFELNYTYADVEMDSAPIGSTAYYYGRPAGHIIGLVAGYDLTPSLTVGGTAEIALENDDTAGVGGMNALDGYEEVNLFASWRPPLYETMELRLDLRNLLDQTYARRSSDGIGMPDRIVALNEPGRSIALTANIDF